MHRRPRVALLSTGDEVVEPAALGGRDRSTTPTDSRPRMVEAAAPRRWTSVSCPISARGAPRAPARGRVRGRRRIDLRRVSVGDLDLVKGVLSEIGGVDFWQVAMQPGRPWPSAGSRGPSSSASRGTPSPRCSASTFSSGRLSGSGEAGRASIPSASPRPRSSRCGRSMGRREFKRGVLRFTGQGFEVSTTGPQGSGILHGRRQLPHHPRGSARRRGGRRARPRRAALTRSAGDRRMPRAITTS